MFYYVPKQRAETERSRRFIMNRNQLLGEKDRNAGRGTEEEAETQIISPKINFQHTLPYHLPFLRKGASFFQLDI